MSNETSKSNNRRKNNKDFTDKYFVGIGCDLGAGGDPLKPSKDFPLIVRVDTFDTQDGDALHFDKWNKNKEYDFLYNSNLLEHLTDPELAIRNWLKCIKTGGYIISCFPEWNLYEHRIWPSQYNSDHKFSFTIFQDEKPGPSHIVVLDMVKKLENEGLVKAEQIILADTNYNYSWPASIDQTRGDAEAFIEIVIRKL